MRLRAVPMPPSYHAFAESTTRVFCHKYQGRFVALSIPAFSRTLLSSRATSALQSVCLCLENNSPAQMRRKTVWSPFNDGLWTASRLLRLVLCCLSVGAVDAAETDSF